MPDISPIPPPPPPHHSPSISPHLLHLLFICRTTRWTPRYFHLSYHFDQNPGGGVLRWLVSRYEPQLSVAFHAAGLRPITQDLPT